MLAFSLLILFSVIFLLRKLRLTVDVICTDANVSEQKFKEVEKALSEIPDSLYEDFATPPTATPPTPPVPIPVLQATCETTDVITTPTVSTGAVPKQPLRRPKQTRIPTKTTAVPILKRWQEDKTQGEDLKVVAASKLGFLKEKAKMIWKWLQ